MKYFKYILILTILLGLFSPVGKIGAQTSPNGECLTVTGDVIEGATEATCKMEWIAGRCIAIINGFRQEITGINQEACKASWHPANAGNSPAKQTPQTSKSNYTLLAPLPCEQGKDAGCDTGKLNTFDPTSGLGAYLNLMIKIFIGLCAVLSVVMIVIGGLEYMTSELAHSKEAGKEKVTHAILGLLIALGAYALLYTINTELLKSDLNIPTIKINKVEPLSGK